MAFLAPLVILLVWLVVALGTEVYLRAHAHP